MSNLAVVAIDGPAGAGKSTISRRVAERLGFLYIDTGAMYRCVALAAFRHGLDLADDAKIVELAGSVRIRFSARCAEVFLNDEDVTNAIRELHISDAASRVSRIPGVRLAMVEEQRRIGQGQPVVMEGRDIGTVVFPAAQVKIFLTAQPAERAKRRASEMEAMGQPANIDEIAKMLAERDARDASRSDSPMAPAADAVHLDSSDLSLDEVEQAILDIAAKRLKGVRQS